tara:strand:- start:46 stop:276 length:231 start_codon:yes stop_codon:yes gene_type:complete
MLLEYIDKLYFFVAFGLGLLFVYLFTPQLKVVYKYPTPENVGSVTYIDQANTCFKYKKEMVDCKKNKDKIKQHNFQ